MKKLLLSSMALALFGIIGTAQKLNKLTKKEKKAGWELLFNGNDFDGWKKFNGGDVTGWKVAVIKRNTGYSVMSKAFSKKIFITRV